MSEKEMLVIEIKGLLDEVGKVSRRAKYDLAYDNLTEITSKTDKIRMIIDRIDEKVVTTIEFDDEF